MPTVTIKYFKLPHQRSQQKVKKVSLQLYIEESVILIKSYKFMELFNTPNH